MRIWGEASEPSPSYHHPQVAEEFQNPSGWEEIYLSAAEVDFILLNLLAHINSHPFNNRIEGESFAA